MELAMMLLAIRAGLLCLLLLAGYYYWRRHNKATLRSKIKQEPPHQSPRLKLHVDVDTSTITKQEPNSHSEGYYLVLDTETYDLITFDEELRQTSFSSPPVALSWQLLDKALNLIEERTFIIKQEGQTKPITDEAIALHGISPKMLEDADGFDALLDPLSQVIRRSEVLVAHNYRFHSAIIREEARRTNSPNLITLLEEKSAICTMEWGRQLGFKQGRSGQTLYPRLDELFGYLYFGRMDVPLSFSSKTLRDVRLVSASLRVLMHKT